MVPENQSCHFCPLQKDRVTDVAADENFCGAPTNVGIGGRYPMQANANITSDTTLATALGVITYASKTIAVVGTQDGRVRKVGELGKAFPSEQRFCLGTVAVDKVLGWHFRPDPGMLLFEIVFARRFVRQLLRITTVILFAHK